LESIKKKEDSLKRGYHHDCKKKEVTEGRKEREKQVSE
jgi:hypothetical protein